MVIHNNSDKFITCVFNHSAITLAPKDSFDCDEKFDSVSFSIVDESYSVLQAKKSKFLKFLSFWDDPFIDKGIPSNSCVVLYERAAC